MIVIRTHPGSASLVGRYVDMTFSDEILGCIAGDDTVFVAPESHRETGTLLKKIELGLREKG
jgi:transcriptional regulator of arginine metabolism